MTQEYLTFEQAKALKELGLPQEEGLGFYQSDANEIGIGKRPNRYIIYTQSIVQKWLREEKNIWIEITTKVFSTTNFVECSVVDNNEQANYKLYWTSYGGTNVCFETYEQALSAGIDKCIELLKDK